MGMRSSGVNGYEMRMVTIRRRHDIVGVNAVLCKLDVVVVRNVRGSNHVGVRAFGRNPDRMNVVSTPVRVGRGPSGTRLVVGSDSPEAASPVEVIGLRDTLKMVVVTAVSTPSDVIVFAVVRTRVHVVVVVVLASSAMDMEAAVSSDSRVVVVTSRVFRRDARVLVSTSVVKG
jgi:hypothetical protein